MISSSVAVNRFRGIDEVSDAHDDGLGVLVGPDAAWPYRILSERPKAGEI